MNSISSSRVSPSAMPERTAQASLQGAFGPRRVAVLDAPVGLRDQRLALADPHETSGPPRSLSDRKVAQGTSARELTDYVPRKALLRDGQALERDFAAEGRPRTLAERISRKPSTAPQKLIWHLDAYHTALGSGGRNPKVYGDVLHKAALALQAELQKCREHFAGPRDPVMAKLLSEVGEELSAVTDIRDIARSLQGNASVSARQVFLLRRDGVPVDTIKRGIAAGRSADEIRQRAEACERAKLPDTVLTEDTPFTHAAHVPASHLKLGHGAINTVWRVDYQIGNRRVPMVFKPEIPGREIGVAAEEAGISKEAPNFAGRARAAYLCSEALGLDLVPTTAVTVLYGQLGSVMAFVDGFQLVSEGSARYQVSAELADRLRKHPDVLKAYALECGCTAAAIEGSVLKLERRTQVKQIDLDSGQPVKNAAGQEVMQTMDLPIRFALPLKSGAFRKSMVRAQWLDALTRQVDRTPMNMMLVPRESGGFDVRLIDNDAAFGTKTSSSSPMKPSNLPARIDRALFDSFMSDAGALASKLEGPLADSGAVELTRKDVLQLQATLRDYDKRGWVLDKDEDWATDKVTQALGIDHDGTQLNIELGKRAKLQAQRNAIPGLARKAGAISYIAREACEQAALRWERNALGGNPELASLPALFDLDELQARLPASDSSADRKSGPPSR